MQCWAIVLYVATALLIPSSCIERRAGSAGELASDMYDTCLKDFSISCVKPKALKWFDEVVKQNEIKLTESLSIIRTGRVQLFAEEIINENVAGTEQMYENVEKFLENHALSIKAPASLKSSEARNFLPDFLLNNALVNGAVIPLTDYQPNESRGFMRKAVLPFLIGLKLKTTVLMPLILALIALKTWKAMTLGLLSLVLSGALVVFKIAKPKVVNYEVVHYPHHHHHVDHIEHVVPHHIEHVVPHHLDHHVDHRLDHHLELPHHVEHIDHLDHGAPAWDPHGWARSSQEPPTDAQDLAFAAQKKR